MANNITSGKSKQKTILTVIILIIIFITVAALSVYLIYFKNIFGSSTRATFYTELISESGGDCPHSLFYGVGDPNNSGTLPANAECILDIGKAQQLLGNNSGSIQTINPKKIKLIKIDADIHTEKELLSPTYTNSSYRIINAIVVNKVYSAELVEVDAP